MKVTKVDIRNTILIAICFIISMPAFILYQTFKNRDIYWKEKKPLNFLLQMYYAIMNRIINVMTKELLLK